MKLELKNKNSLEILKEISQLEKEIFLTSAYSYETLLDMLEKEENYEIYVYERDRKILAYLLAMNAIDSYEILKIATISEYRNQGIAGALIKVLKGKDIFLEVRESNKEAINFYEKNFFEKISIRKKYYKDNNENAIIMKMEVENE